MIKYHSLLLGALALAAAIGAASCSSDATNQGPYCGTSTSYPTAEARTVPSDLVLEGPNGSFDASKEFAACGASQALVVLRVTAPWCGTCGWHADNWSSIVDTKLRSQLRMVDVLVGDAANAAPTLETATEWSQRATGTDQTVIDPSWRVSGALAKNVQLPAYVVIDPRTMNVLDVVGNPSPGQLRTTLQTAVATVTGATAPAPEQEELYDGLFTANERDMLRGITRPTKSVPDPSNRFADNSVTAAVGRTFFFETAWSKNGQISCESCHQPNAGFADGLSVSKGIGLTDRNAMTALMAGQYPWFFADGRADSAWMQALGPLENANEFGSSRLRVAHVVAEKFADAYARAFGEPLPDLSDATRFPPDGKPGDPSWEAMAPSDRAVVTKIFTNVGKGIQAYERTIIVSENPFDRYAAGQTQALSPDEKLGLKEFFTLGCAQCHYGPMLADGAFHSLRFPTGRADGAVDRGRLDGLALLAQSEFNRAGTYSDDPQPAYQVPTELARFDGAFKTPTLRAVAATAPYGHGGTLADLEAVVQLYRTGGLPAGDARASGTWEPWVPTFGSHEGTHLSAFMQTFVGGAVWW